MCVSYIDSVKNLEKADEEDTFPNLNNFELSMTGIAQKVVENDPLLRRNTLQVIAGGFYLKSSKFTWSMAMPFLAMFTGITACIIICVCACCCSNK